MEKINRYIHFDCNTNKPLRTKKNEEEQRTTPWSPPVPSQGSRCPPAAEGKKDQSEKERKRRKRMNERTNERTNE
jgi:hypothetical protein